MQVVDQPSPFQRFLPIAKSIRMYIKASPLGSTRKITPLTQGQFMRAVESMYVGGFGMMQVRHHALSRSCFAVIVAAAQC